MKKVPINRIIECSTVDGPGLRTAVFVQKCNIRCLYCHNPETQNLCNGCKACLSVCPSKALSYKEGRVVWNPGLCVSCDQCIHICPNHASPKIEYLSAKEVYDRIKPNRAFLSGITVSGGECSLYPEFLTDLFSLAKKDGLSTLLDSNGMIDYSLYPELLKVTDGVMLDIKSWDKKVYHDLTGDDNDIVKKNLKYLDGIEKIQELRIVVVDSYVDAESCLEGIQETIRKNHLEKTHIKLIRFRRNGVRSRLSSYPSPTMETMEKLKEKALSLGLTSVEIS